MNKYIRKGLASLALLCAVGMPQAHAYTHPCIPNTLEELDTIKASLNQEPWKQGYAVLAGDSHSQLTYTMQGPATNVSRAGSYDQYLGAWTNDMTAVYNLARMWYFTGNAAYAQKARDILIAWANTHTSFTGNESGLALGDYAVCYGGGASILRGTWSGWTATDTTTVKNYFSNVLWPGSLAGYNVMGPANKGAIYMEAGIAIAAFCDDTAKFDHIVNLFRADPAGGLQNTLPSGEMGETGRDAGHAFGTLNGLAFVAEVAWKQGIDLYSELDNRLLACGEYYARNTFLFDNPFVPFGTIDYHYWVNPAGPYTGNRSAFYLLQNAYKNRKNLPTPWIDRKLEDQSVDGSNFMYAKTADFTTATPPPALGFPAVSLASSGLTLTTLGTQTAGRSASYANGAWTVTGLGSGPWNDTADDCQFVYQTMTGDCALVAKVTSCTYLGSSNSKAGLMIRDTLTAAVSQRAWGGIVAAPTNKLEAHMRGWTENWGGSNRAQRSQELPPGIPYWLKIERRGNLLTTFSSQDGTSWAPVLSSYYGNLPATLHIGLFVSSGTTTPTTATFANVAFTGGTGGLVTTPAAPAALFASGSSKAITLRWLPSFGATAYDLLRSTTSDSGYTALVSNLSTATTSYVDTSAVAGTTYYYVAQAKNSAGTSGNSPQFGASLLTTPMVNLAFGGTPTATIADNGGSEAPDKAFDRNPGSKWLGWAPTGSIQYDFGAGNAQVVKCYTINCADVANRDPKSWNFRGSQDGTNWTTLDSKSNQSFITRFAMNTYNLANTTAYRFYQLEVTANNGATSVAVAELGLWGDSGRTLRDGTYCVVSRYSNKVMTALSGGTANGTKFVQWGYTGGNEQKWTFTHLGSGQYKVTGLASGRVMDVNGLSTANGAKIQLWDSTGGNNQKWTVTPAGDGYVKITAVHSGKVADVKGPSTADGADVHQWTYISAHNQQWLISIVP